MARHYKPKPRDYNPPRTCGGKYCYPSRRDAEAVVTEKSILQPEIELAIYRCLSCRQFHLTRVEKT